MHAVKTELIEGVAQYYSEKFAAHGQTPRGVDWNGEASQRLRFSQLAKIIAGDTEVFSLTDLGCGYGALLDDLLVRYPGVSYLGVDIASAMIDAAKSIHVASPNVRFICAAEPDGISDYMVASGIFNVRLTWTDAAWFEYLSATLEMMDRGSARGFAFNCLTSYSDREKMRDDLYYADPCRLFDLCKRRYSRDVALLHDYGLYEFTILVRKSS